MATGYEDIDKVMQQQNTLLEQQQQKSNEIVDLGLQQTQARVDKQKAEYDTEATKAGKQLYTNYRKASNPYGATAEQLASQDLGNSGYAESTKANIYNTYQKNATSLMVETQKLKADADFEMNQAYLSADIQKAQNAMAIYQQKAQLVLQEYEMKFNREQFDFQKEQFNYQKERDAMSDQRWQQEFELSLAKSKKAKDTSSDFNTLLNEVSNEQQGVVAEESPLSEGGQDLLNKILANSGDPKSILGGIQGTAGLTEKGAMDMLKFALKKGSITQTDYDILKTYFE